MTLDTDTILQSVPWETRNLGRPCYTISESFIVNAREVTLRRALADAHANSGESGIFVQVRLTRKNQGAAACLQNCGFRFAELTLHPYSRLNENAALARYSTNPTSFLDARKRSTQNVRVKVLEHRETATVEQVLLIAGNSFEEDRFHQDPICPRALADIRYVNWTRDMLSDPHVQFTTLHVDDQVLGFIARKADQLLLTATRKFADFFWLDAIQRAWEEGQTVVNTTITASNPDVLNLYARLHFKFRHPETTFHYWS